jgi:hypothetical protein
MEMKICSASFQPDVTIKTHMISKYLCPLPMAIITIWLFASAASSCPTNQPAAAGYSGVTQSLPATMSAHPAKVAAIDEDDGDNDQADPDDPNDTLAAADAFWQEAADVTRRATQT